MEERPAFAVGERFEMQACLQAILLSSTPLIAYEPESVATVGTGGLIAEARNGGKTKINLASDSAFPR